jgi:hypothetical protein
MNKADVEGLVQRDGASLESRAPSIGFDLLWSTAIVAVGFVVQFVACCVAFLAVIGRRGMSYMVEECAMSAMVAIAGEIVLVCAAAACMSRRKGRWIWCTATVVICGTLLFSAVYWVWLIALLGV